MASYGRLELLKQAVNSTLGQRYENYEIIIIDDGSGEDVAGWLKQIESTEAKKSVYHQSHQGVAAARANGVDKAETDFVSILDSDDILAPGALETLVEAMLQSADIELVSTLRAALCVPPVRVPANWSNRSLN